MEYKILDRYNIKEYLDTISSIKEYFSEEELFIDEIGDGNLNYVFIIKSVLNENKALILKQAVPYLRCVGEEYPLSKDRMTYEIRALTSFANTTPQHTPKIYDVNENMSTVIMQFLDTHIILREGMILKKIYPNFSKHISTHLAENLFKTSSLYLSSTDKRKLINNFNSNTELCKLTEDFVFTFAFMEHETNDEYATNNSEFNSLVSNMQFKKEVLDLKYKFMTNTDALVHGDLHTGSIMLNENETFVIDPEFAFVGPFGFDIGALVANLTMSYISHIVLNPQDKYSSWILETITETLELFEEKFLELWNKQSSCALITQGFIDEEHLGYYKNEFLLNILKDSVGFAGCKMARRMFGIAGVADIRDISNKEKKDLAIELTLKVAKRFVIEHKYISKIEDVINIIKDEVK